MDNGIRPVVQMLAQLERQWFTITPVLNPARNVREMLISCKHCNYQSRHDDNDQEQAAGAAAVFLKHLKTNHADLLKRENTLSVELL